MMTLSEKYNDEQDKILMYLSEKCINVTFFAYCMDVVTINPVMLHQKTLDQTEEMKQIL